MATANCCFQSGTVTMAFIIIAEAVIALCLSFGLALAIAAILSKLMNPLFPGHRKSLMESIHGLLKMGDICGIIDIVLLTVVTFCATIISATSTASLKVLYLRCNSSGLICLD